MKTLEQKFLDKVHKTETCWLWTAGKTPKGYGKLKVQGKTLSAHRLSYELYKGEIPEGLTIDHLCFIKHCTNPSHLEAVTNQENNLRGNSYSAINARKTHCKYGHEFTPENTAKRGLKYRRCIKCRNREARESYYKNKDFSNLKHKEFAHA